MKTQLAILIATLLGAAACGGDDGAVDAGIDARLDAAPPDAEVDRCQILCGCTDEYCDQDLATCMTDCATLEVSVRECRIEHCGYAQTNPGFHCPHALGDMNSPGVPPACVAN